MVKEEDAMTCQEVGTDVLVQSVELETDVNMVRARLQYECLIT